MARGYRGVTGTGSGPWNLKGFHDPYLGGHSLQFALLSLDPTLKVVRVRVFLDVVLRPCFQGKRN
jgi:hypothetical protein